MQLPHEMLVVLAVVAAVLVFLARTRVPADAILVGGLLLLTALPVPTSEGWRLGVISAADAIAGFSNPGVITVGVLFIVAAGLRETGAVDLVTNSLLGRPRSDRGALWRVTAPTLALSSVLNNTPVVALMIPAVQSFSRRLKTSSSKFLIPLSYAAILGGTCTLIGTSTNLVVAGLVIAQTDLEPIRMFDITWVGLPCAIVGLAFLILLGPKLLPNRRAAESSLEDSREYALELRVPEGSPIAGCSVEQAGLRGLPGSFLVEIERSGETISAVGPEQMLRAGDRLLFVGVVESIRDLVLTRGLALTTDETVDFDTPRFRRRLFEVVLSATSPLLGRTIREGRFRSLYEGAVIAVSRNGERLRGKLGEVKLRAGDLLLVEAAPDFATRVGQSRDFLLVSPLANSTPPRRGHAGVSIAIFAAMIVLAVSGAYPMLIAALLAAAAMIVTGCCTITNARKSIDWSLLIVIGATLGIGEAMDQSGAARLLAGSILAAAGAHPWLVLIGVYIVTALLTEIITNNAAVAIVFPIAYAAASALGVDFMPFVIAIMMAGSASFITPLGYQTNLMVYGPGGYSYGDFMRIGIPMSIVVGATAIVMTLFWFRF